MCTVSRTIKLRPVAIAVCVVAVASVHFVFIVGFGDVRVGPVVVGVFVVFQEHRRVEQDLADGTAEIQRLNETLHTCGRIFKFYYPQCRFFCLCLSSILGVQKARSHTLQVTSSSSANIRSHFKIKAQTAYVY